jgi:DNA-directed RNA polymerase subunit RPC12/RpoP
MAARVCAECNKATGAVGCSHWERWPENLNRLHNWTEKIDRTMKVKCKECGLETTVVDLATGKTDSFNCPRYKIQRPC